MRAFYVSALAVVAAAALSVPVAAQDAQRRLEIVDAPTSRSTGPVAVGVDFDVLCSGRIAPEGLVLPATIVGAQMISSQTSFVEGDILYLDIGSNRGAAPGQEYWVVRPEETVWADESELHAVGRFYNTPARLRIICVQEEASIAELTNSCTETAIGDNVLPFEPVPIPLVRPSRMLTSCDPASGHPVGRIVRVKDLVVPVGQESIVYIDLGSNDVQPGQFLTVYRTHPTIPSVRTILGEIAVLASFESTAVAKVTYSRDVIYKGDSVEVK